MDLNNYKIPIISGKNDIPTTNNSQPNHPNGSFLIAKYNSLIDVLASSLSDSTTNLNIDDLLTCILYNSEKIIICNYDNELLSGSRQIDTFFDLNIESFSIPNIQENCVVNQYHTFYFGTIGIFTANSNIIWNFNNPITNNLIIPLIVKYNRPNSIQNFYQKYHILFFNATQPEFYPPFTGE